MTSNPILQVETLSLAAKNRKTLVSNVSFSLHRGETLGLVGESGSGKSLTLRAILGLLPTGIEQTSGIITSDEKSAMVFQDPRGALDPLCPVVKQLTEVVYYRQRVSRKAARSIALDLLERLGLPPSLKKGDRYPNQLSGGQCQRVVIAIALACQPNVLLCDEPTTALDVTVQKQIIETIKQLQQELGFAMVFVTHNLAIAATMCSKLCVMKQGHVVEQGATEDILSQPQDPYTQMLVDSVLPIPELKGGEVRWS